MSKEYRMSVMDFKGGDTATISATVKEHAIYNDERQTIIEMPPPAKGA